MQTKLICTLLLSFILLSFNSCRKDVAQDNLEFIGDWEGENTSLVIRANGYGSYQYSDGFVSKSISGRVVFKGSQIKFAFLTFSKKYTIDQRPKPDGFGSTTMVLSGETFTKY